MILNLFKHSLRALRKQKAYVAINVFGLAIGLTVSLIISLYIINELSYDRYHKDGDRIYTVILDAYVSGQEIIGAYTAVPVGPTMAREFPEVESYCRLNPWGETVVKYEDKIFTESRYVESDSTFFDFFSIRLLEGDPTTVLAEPYSVVLSKSSAEKIFESEDPLGKRLQIGTTPVMHKVTGIMEDFPSNTHFQANILGSFSSNPRYNENFWLSNSYHTYIKLHPKADPDDVNTRFTELLYRYAAPEVKHFLNVDIEDFFLAGNRYNMFLEPLHNLKTNPRIEFEMVQAVDPKYFLIFGSIGLLILIIASINFMNLSTAQATKRAREVGIKKVSGSSRELLISQFLLETVILSVVAMIVAVGFTEIALPRVNNLFDINLSLWTSNSIFIFPALALGVILIGVLSGVYPAFFMSAFNPNEVLKGKATNGRGSIFLRKGLTVLQLSISIILIVGTLIMHRQINYMLDKDLGFDSDQILVLRRAEALGQQGESFKQELLQIPGILAVSRSTAVPGRSNNNNGYSLNIRPGESFLLQSTWVDYDFLKTYGIGLSQGRFFDPEMQTDNIACVINERTIRNFMLEDLDEVRFIPGTANPETAPRRPVIGVVKDYHFESLRQEIEPSILILKNPSQTWGYVSIRLAGGGSAKVLNEIEKVWKSFTGGEPLPYLFLNQDLQRMYQQERQNASMSVAFTILAIIIATLGLFGLMSFTISQRTREIGVRKTFGASTSGIWFMISKEIFFLVTIATLIAWPVVYYVGSNWLENYHYRSSLNISDFLAGLIIAALIAVTTISYHALKAARMNPSISLRYE
jgi:putative ABC transport system permease protein